MNYLLDWQKAKNEIDLEQYFLFKMGSLYTFDKYKKAYVLKDNQSTGDIIRFFYHEKTGVKMYYSITFQDSGDIIQFIKKRILNNTESTAEEVNNEIRSYLGNLKDNIRNRPKAMVKLEKKEKENKDYAINGDIIQKIEAHYDYLTDYRKLSANTLKTNIFRNIFFTYKTKSCESLAYYIKDIKGRVVGINRVYTQKGEFFNRKWFDKGSRNSLGFTFSPILPETETLSIFESIFDAMSFYELYNFQGLQYCITNGEISFGKAKLIQQHFAEVKFKKIILGNDNDIAGNFFNLNILCIFLKSVISVKKSSTTICIEMNANEERLSSLLHFFKKADCKFELEYNIELPQSYFTETLSHNREHYFFMISNTVDSIQFFTDLLMRIWNLSDFVVIYQPKNKDFNEDLIKLKSKKND